MQPLLDFFGTLWTALPRTVAQGLVWGVMAIGLYITYKILDVADLTVDGSICTGAATCAILITNGVNVYLALLIAFIAGCLAGLVTGLFHTFLGIPPILSGILTQLMLWSINIKIMGGRANLAISRNVRVILTQMNPGSAIIAILIVVAVIIGVLYWFFGTALGAGIRATGNNLNMSRAQGINTDLNKVLGLMISNGIVAISGALLAQFQGFADINMGRGAIVIGLAAIIIGEAIFSKIGQNFALRLTGVAVGGIIYYIVYQIVSLIGLDTDYLKMLSALIVAIFLGVPYLKRKYFAMKKDKEGKSNA
ncbi:MAG: ABC transporter permease [Clostridia bacterium]|nr:ABC transporter permease [Clostridia bacterium]